MIRIRAIDAARSVEPPNVHYGAMGEFDVAGEQFNEAGRLNSEGMRPVLKQAGFLAQRDKHEENDELFDFALSRHPNEPKVWWAVTTACVLAKRKSRIPEARKLVERYLETPNREPNSDPRSEVRDVFKRLQSPVRRLLSKRNEVRGFTTDV